jgi:hypothetical protein
MRTGYAPTVSESMAAARSRAGRLVSRPHKSSCTGAVLARRVPRIRLNLPLPASVQCSSAHATLKRHG